MTFNLLGSKKGSSVLRPQICLLLQNALLFYCTLYTDCPWQNRCCRASRELCADYLFTV